MSSIGPKTNVFIFFNDYRGRIWLGGAHNFRNKRYELVLKPELFSEPSEARGFPYELAVVMKRRFDSEGVMDRSIYETKFTLAPGTDTEEIATGQAKSAPDAKGREVTECRGLLVRPGYGNEFWWIKFPGTARESIKGVTPEDAAEKVFERNLYQFAEKAPAPPPPPEPETVVQNVTRIRPGDLYER
jgi:hypothetical protein